MEDISTRLTPVYASSEAVEAVVHAALYDAITNVLAESVSKKMPRDVRSALVAVQWAYRAVVMSAHYALQDEPLSPEANEWAMSDAAIAEYRYFAAMTRWRGEWLMRLYRDTADASVMSPPVPNPSEFFTVYGEALADAFPVESWAAMPQHIVTAIKELTRGYEEVGSSLRTITCDQGKPDPDRMPVAAKVLADLSETEATTMGVMIAARLFWIFKSRRRHTSGPLHG